MPTREDVLAIRSIEEAFDVSTRKVRKREVALIRVAAKENLVELSGHAMSEADDEWITREDVPHVIERGKAASKDVTESAGRQVGINFEGALRDRRSIRAKVSWGLGYFIATVHTL